MFAALTNSTMKD
jgi:hypothetical protein